MDGGFVTCVESRLSPGNFNRSAFINNTNHLPGQNQTEFHVIPYGTAGICLAFFLLFHDNM